MFCGLGHKSYRLNRGPSQAMRARQLGRPFRGALSWGDGRGCRSPRQLVIGCRLVWKEVLTLDKAVFFCRGPSSGGTYCRLGN